MTTIYRYKARLPGDNDGPPLPAIFVNEAIEADYLYATLDDPDCSSMQTDIYYWSGAGKRHAERIASDLKTSGVALVYPGDRDIRIYVGIRHTVIEIGARVPDEDGES